MLAESSPGGLDRKVDLPGLLVTFSLTLASNEIIFPSGSPPILRFFLTDEIDGSECGGRFLHERFLVPGFLSGPLRFGTESYSHSLLRRVQLLQTGLVESQRIFRARLESQQIKAPIYRWRIIVGRTTVGKRSLQCLPPDEEAAKVLSYYFRTQIAYPYQAREKGKVTTSAKLTEHWLHDERTIESEHHVKTEIEVPLICFQVD